MKVVAHPLVVAVALGLLAPVAFADELQNAEEPTFSLECDDAHVATVEVSEAEQARAEQEWLEVRDLI